ncbi:Envelope biogenesis factor ElyC [Halomicronema hongdechloris C2206]|uniref:Envelope biogenesis factor ElyC n=1 Tax=Halomicronema hongdechloris C2206 TaxID=1641165 RepID=A0A1Z3HUK0_9CYAN|nr:YdcF family protein [Halomicronema hongdechloris]ASC73956.1 Envelope biogenesis factor ElyC [Halomicronema hongdechloris C2206]
MFLLLSKLLPLLLYPLGLACLLLLVALVLLWRRPRWAAGAIATSLALLFISSNSWVADRFLQSLEWQHLPSELPNADAIVVLGGGMRPASSPRAWVEVSEAGDRVLHGARLYLAGKAPWLILSGGRIPWLDGGGAPESSDMAALATALGVPEEAILQDPTSLNTYQNAINVKALLQTYSLERVLLVTSALHMPRALALFRHQGIDAAPAPTDFLLSKARLQTAPQWQAHLVNFFPDARYLHEVTQALKEYLGLLVYRLRGWL